MNSSPQQEVSLIIGIDIRETFDCGMARPLDLLSMAWQTRQQPGYTYQHLKVSS